MRKMGKFMRKMEFVVNKLKLFIFKTETHSLRSTIST